VKPIKNFVDRMLRSMGVVVRLAAPHNDRLSRRRHVLAKCGIDCVFDVGAHVGDYAADLRAAGYSGKIVSFEPLPAPHAELAKRAAADPLWIAAERCALGNTHDRALMHVSRNLVSSSLLKASPELAVYDSDTKSTREVEVPVHTLSDQAREHVAPNSHCLVKIDAQGFEKQILEGAYNVLAQVFIVEVEVSFAELYVGQAGWREVIDYLEREQFQIWDIEPAFYARQSGRLLQADVTFVRNSVASDVS
jgi:FkbM family methyltransferase